MVELLTNRTSAANDSQIIEFKVMEERIAGPRLTPGKWEPTLVTLKRSHPTGEDGVTCKSLFS